MKFWLKIVIIAAISLVAGIGFVPEASAVVKFSNISVSEIENGSANVRWETDIETRGMIYYGESANQLDKKMGYSLYDYDHELLITGLKKNKTYLFKIVAISELEIPHETESFLQTFSTKSMKREETVQPAITESKVLDVLSNAIAITWTTDEQTTATIYFREEAEKAYRKTGYGNLAYYHEKVISGLKPQKRYYIRIEASDKFGNKSNAYFTTNTPSGITAELRIFDIEPLSFDDRLISSKNTTIRWKTNRVTKASVSYGKNLSRLSFTAGDLSPIRKTDHEIRLTDLDPDSLYYYSITATDAFSNKSVAKTMSFRTQPPRKALRNGSVVKGSGYKVYVIDGNTKRWIKTADVFIKLGYKWRWIEQVEDYLLSDYKEGAVVSVVKTHPNGTLVKYPGSSTVYLLENGKKRPISSADAFNRMGFDWSRIITISKREAYKTGEYL